MPKPDWPAGGETVRFRLGASELAQYVDPRSHDKVLTGTVVHVYASYPDVDVKVPDWASLHTVRVADLLPGPAVIDGEAGPGRDR